MCNGINWDSGEGQFQLDPGLICGRLNCVHGPGSTMAGEICYLFSKQNSAAVSCSDCFCAFIQPACFCRFVACQGPCVKLQSKIRQQVLEKVKLVAGETNKVPP